MMRGYRWTSMVVSVYLLAAGCVKAPPVPPDQFYRLPEPVSDQVTKLVQWRGLVLVTALRSDGLHTERALVFSEDAGALSLARYHYHHWIDGPPKLVQEYVASRIRAAASEAMVITERAGRPEIVVSGKVKGEDLELS